MKTFERIFLYSVLAILVFYVFLVDDNAESQGVSLGQHITAKSINILNDEGRAVIMLWNNENGGMINIANKKGDLTFLVSIGEDKNGNGVIMINNKSEKPVALMGATNSSGGQIGVSNEDGNPAVVMASNKDEDGRIFVFNKRSDVIGSLP